MICKILLNYFQSWQIYWQNKKGISSIETQCISEVNGASDRANYDFIELVNPKHMGSKT